MWPFTRKPNYELLDMQAEAIRQDIDKGQLLSHADNDTERYRMCIRWAEEARDNFYAGRRETIARVVASRDLRYRQYGRDVRVSIGERLWGNSVKAREYVGLEQMYARWASQYATGPESRTPPVHPALQWIAGKGSR